MKISEDKKRIIPALVVLSLIVVLLQLAGNVIRIGEFSISLILIPVAVGAVLCGPWGGAWLGFLFGIVLVMTGETDAYKAVSPFYTFLDTALRGAAAGFASGAVYSSVSRKKEDLAIVLASVTAPVVNTGIFVVLTPLLFYDLLESIMGYGKVFPGMIKYYVSINFLIELALNMVLTPALIRFAKILDKTVPQKTDRRQGDRKKLAAQLSVVLMLLGVLICLVSSVSGYRNYRKSMEKQYNDTAYHIAQTAESYLDAELIRECLQKSDISRIKADPAYISTRSRLNNLCDSMGAEEIIVAAAVYNAAYNASGDSEMKTQLSCLFACGSNVQTDLGDTYIPAAPFTEGIAECLRIHQRPDDYLITEDERGESTSAVLGFYDDTGELSAVIVVRILMDAVRRSVSSDIITSIVMMICIEVIFITLYFYYISYRVIEPIRMISEEVSGFVKNENQSGGSLEHIHTRDEIQQLAEDIVRMEEDIGSYITRITAITAERERINTELNVAARLQADMLPSAFPEREDFDIFASMTPAREVGGDFYDFFMTDDDHIAIVIADVSDKGVPAALFMVVAKTLIKNQTSFSSSPKEILEAINNQLWNNNRSRMFVTAWLCIFEISTGRCAAANAGHEYPAIRGADGAFELMKDRHGFVLGGAKNSSYSEYEFTLEKGGAVFVYTDGVPEAENAGQETFGTERMLHALNIDSGASAEGIISNVQSAVGDFVQDAPQFDDITMLCIRKK